MATAQERVQRGGGLPGGGRVEEAAAGADRVEWNDIFLYLWGSEERGAVTDKPLWLAVEFHLDQTLQCCKVACVARE